MNTEFLVGAERLQHVFPEEAREDRLQTSGPQDPSVFVEGKATAQKPSMSAASSAAGSVPAGEEAGAKRRKQQEASSGSGSYPKQLSLEAALQIPRPSPNENDEQRAKMWTECNQRVRIVHSHLVDSDENGVGLQEFWIGLVLFSGDTLQLLPMFVDS